MRVIIKIYQVFLATLTTYPTFLHFSLEKKTTTTNQKSWGYPKIAAFFSWSFPLKKSSTKKKTKTKTHLLFLTPHLNFSLELVVQKPHFSPNQSVPRRPSASTNALSPAPGAAAWSNSHRPRRQRRRPMRPLRPPRPLAPNVWRSWRVGIQRWLMVTYGDLFLQNGERLPWKKWWNMDILPGKT